MSVLVVTSLGDIVVDLYTIRCPLTTKNFLKLCKIKYFNGCLFHTVQKDFTAQTGDPTGEGSGGDSIYKFLFGDQARFFGDEIHPDLKHNKIGTVAMVSGGENMNASQFYFTLRDDLEYLDGKDTVFGEVAEGLETLTRINEAYVDENGRPFKNIRIKHTYILDDPFDDPSQLAELIPDASPEGKPQNEIVDEVRLEDDWMPMDELLDSSELEEVLRDKQAHTSAVVLESIGDIPDAEMKPPENVLFVCKLNPVTEDEDLNTIFSRFGNVVSAEVIRDFKTGDSLCYAFIEFDNVEACEQAYYKMDNTLIDDRRIHVDFSQSVAKLWSQYRRNGNQSGTGRGCFKCGSFDHIAKDCTGDPSVKAQPLKYTLKDDNIQRGGDDKSRYEMVFDGDTLANSEGVKKHQDDEPKGQGGRRGINKLSPEGTKSRAHEKRNSISDRHRLNVQNIGNREEERGRRIVYDGRRLVEDYDGKRATNDREDHRRHASEGDRMKERDYKYGDRRTDQKEERDYRTNDSHGKRKDEPDYKKRSSAHEDRRERSDSRKGNRGNDSHGDRREGRDSRKRSTDNDHKHCSDKRDRDGKRR
ncbi:hypothetical protein GIB67_027836 [Kingdonia uniflora]|uniref:Peptidyl-prolyl cis-trans isomerase n=1 Tax=Kingdonia uniflora TaxID=39325 RepID=A0A7J7P4K0_9MAGN|nr:hypothetical protein GIB67_027836 [Kingdonia uniflora]